MVNPCTLLAGLVAAACVSASASPANEDAFFAALLKRQEPGSPSYNCHDNCGLAITLSRGATPCTDSRFLGAYANCIQCSGPDNYNIWRMYGGTLATAGGKCNLETTPKTGKQADVPPAGSSGQPGGSSASSASLLASSTLSQVSSTSAGMPAPTSGAPAPSASASSSPTASTSAPAQQSTNAAPGIEYNAVGFFGAMFMGVMYGM